MTGVWLLGCGYVSGAADRFGLYPQHASHPTVLLVFVCMCVPCVIPCTDWVIIWLILTFARVDCVCFTDSTRAHVNDDGPGGARHHNWPVWAHCALLFRGALMELFPRVVVPSLAWSITVSHGVHLSTGRTDEPRSTAEFLHDYIHWCHGDCFGFRPSPRNPAGGSGDRLGLWVARELPG